ncbi:VOC family protein [Chitinophaga horti]|uniref:VOC family protein n=1 Tax=Chitinophaga horti TaxID=2920382 RepID=A0ABY6J885_9BACT|nr:VOC family protein [Chitinophaga horti]UYQ94517.1 VOC family protein [Chitinophaga horti]
MFRFKKIDHVAITIPAGKSDEAKAFYGGILELVEIPGNHPRSATWYEMGDIQLHIVEEAMTGPVSGRHPAFEVDDLDKAKEYLETNNIQVSYSSLIEGRERLFFRDPFGNRIELIEYL